MNATELIYIYRYRRNLQEHCYYLSFRRAAEIIVDTMLEYPNNNSYDHKRKCNDNPQLQCEWLEEHPSTRFRTVHWSYYDKSSGNVRLSKINHSCSVCYNSYVSNSSIENLSTEYIYIAVCMMARKDTVRVRNRKILYYLHHLPPASLAHRSLDWIHHHQKVHI